MTQLLIPDGLLAYSPEKSQSGKFNSPGMRAFDQMQQDWNPSGQCTNQEPWVYEAHERSNLPLTIDD